MAFIGDEITILASARNLTDRLGRASGDWIAFSGMRLEAPSTNAGTVFVGRSDVTLTTNRMASIAAGAAISIEGGVEGRPLLSDDVYVIGTANDVLFVTLIA